jgi:hypothetical protein
MIYYGQEIVIKIIIVNKNQLCHFTMQLNEKFIILHKKLCIDNYKIKKLIQYFT